ncbi:trans-aconitate 2-methyltransferase [Streptomyces amakusaensis]|uniref:Trans-aconitate 2-methyltransferase n=1 Tax=Streptomyces amakusaensis TaxID=67271 RepID=A0ABW0ARX6_9ACTN
MPSTPIWDPQQYLRHAGHRTRPFLDLLARIPDPPAPEGRRLRIADLGCGAGNVTALLADRWPAALITGFDNSLEMLARAGKQYAGPTPGGGSLGFQTADAVHWSPAEPYDVIVSNALFHWVPGHLDSFARWVDGLAPGGTFAFQVPGNFDAPSHTLLAELCASPRWRDRLGGDQGRSYTERPAVYLDRLTGLGAGADGGIGEVDVWETTYLQLLTGEDPVLDWIKGTTLRPVLTVLESDPAALEAFLGEYRALLRDAYPPGPHGTVFPFRRIFAVARKAV